MFDPTVPELPEVPDVPNAPELPSTSDVPLEPELDELALTEILKELIENNVTIPPDLKVDDRDFKEFANFYDWCFSRYGADQPPFARQLELAIKVLEIPREALFLTGKAYLKYRKNKGTKNSPLPDFFIGAHVSVEDFDLITRDTNKYTTYFPQVKLIHKE